MTDIETELSDFEGLAVVRSAIEMPGAAGGLRDALKVQPMEAHRGERVFVVLEVEVAKLRHDPAKVDDGDPDAWVRVHIMDIKGVALVDEELVREALDTMASRIAEAKAVAQAQAEELAGIKRLPVDGLCPFPGCTLDDEHEGDHQQSTVVDTLRKLKKAELAALCDSHQIVPGGKATTAPAMVELLRDVPGIEAEAQAVLDARPEAGDNVTALHPDPQEAQDG